MRRASNRRGKSLSLSQVDDEQADVSDTDARCSNTFPSQADRALSKSCSSVRSRMRSMARLDVNVLQSQLQQIGRLRLEVGGNGSHSVKACPNTRSCCELEAGKCHPVCAKSPKAT